ncbi:MAG: hypothetical protein WCK13_05020 [Ignavibacteriota bacterium]|nr:hypothetical protein [Ignavibacteriota bacterium]
MKNKLLILLAFMIAMSAFSKLSYSQEKSSHFYEMNYLSLNYDQLEDFMKFYEEVGKPMDAQNEFILSIKVFRHFSGPSWNVCFISEYKDFESMGKAQKRGDEIFMKMFTDKPKQDEVMKKWMGYMRGHTDALVNDVPSLEKK